jgi:transcriptional regulator with XRE-family HTH domain
MMQGSLATRLRILRVKEGLMIGEAADKMGIDRHTLGRVEQGTQMPHAPTLKKIAAGYGVSVEDLLQAGPVEAPGDLPKVEAPTSSTLADSEATDEARRLIDLSPAAFYKKLAEAPSDADLLDLYHRIDAEYTGAELAYREDEDNRTAYRDYARAISRHMMAFLSLKIRGITPPDPELLATRVRELEALQK